MRGIPFFNFPAFDAARDALKAEGWNVLSPADIDRSTGFDPVNIPSPETYDWMDLQKIDFSLKDAAIRDTQALTECDAIYMLDGWQTSRGAKAEKAIAEWLGLEVLYQNGESILEEAQRLVGGDRGKDYGPPDADFARTAAMWTALKGVEFEAREVAMFMICVKLSREVHRPKRDNAVDMAGYSLCLDICNQVGGYR